MLRLPTLPLAALALVTAATAQTTHTTSTTHRSTTATHRATSTTAAKPVCATVPELSPKIPALPAGTACPRPLFTITEKLDYVSPLMSPEAREGFSNLPMTITLAYQEEKVGTGELAKPHMYYTVQYTGYLVDGTKFDSSLDHPNKEPLTFPYGGHQVIPGWDIGFEGMHVGGKRRLFIPFQLAYGERGRGPIPARAELVFDMELVSQSADRPAPPTPPTPPASPAGASPAGAPPAGAPPAGAPPTGALPGSVPPPAGSPQPPAPQSGPDTKPAPPVGNSPGTATPPQP